MTHEPIFVIRRPMNTESSPSCSRCGSWWRLPLLLALVLAGIFWWRFPGSDGLPEKNEKNLSGTSIDAESEQKVSLTVDFGDGRRKNFDALPWHEGATVA